MFAGSTVFTWVKSRRFSRRYSDVGSDNHILDVYGPTKSNHGRFFFFFFFFLIYFFPLPLVSFASLPLFS